MPRFTCCIKEPTDCSESAAGTILFQDTLWRKCRKGRWEHAGARPVDERRASDGTRASNIGSAVPLSDADSLIVLDLDVRKLRSCAPLKLQCSKSSRPRCNCGSFRCPPGLSQGRHWCGR